MAARLPHVGVDVDGLSCSLQHPTTYNRQTRGHAYYQALPCLIKLEWAVALFLGDAMSPGLDIYWSVDHLGTCATKLYMDYVFFSRTRSPYVRGIMVFMRVSLVEPLF
jgi:hypothetical protein